MNISRKDFFKKSLLSLGEAVGAISTALKGSDSVPVEIPDTTDFAATPHEEMVAAPSNQTCLAKNSGCFACMERCEPGAIKLIPGVGIRINPQICTGCGTCEYVCPVSPKAIRMQARAPIPTPSALPAESPSPKGETPC
jgi:ferredoxin